MRYPTKEEWPKLIDEYRASGLSQKEFVAKHDISFQTLQYWLYQREKRLKVGSGSSPRFLPVEVVSSPAPKARPGGQDFIEVLVSEKVVLRFAVGTDTEYIAELLCELG